MRRARRGDPGQYPLSHGGGWRVGVARWMDATVRAWTVGLAVGHCNTANTADGPLIRFRAQEPACGRSAPHSEDACPPKPSQAIPSHAAATGPAAAERRSGVEKGAARFSRRAQDAGAHAHRPAGHPVAASARPAAAWARPGRNGPVGSVGRAAACRQRAAPRRACWAMLGFPRIKRCRASAASRDLARPRGPSPARRTQGHREPAVACAESGAFRAGCLAACAAESFSWKNSAAWWGLVAMQDRTGATTRQ